MFVFIFHLIIRIRFKYIAKHECLLRAAIGSDILCENQSALSNQFKLITVKKNESWGKITHVMVLCSSVGTARQMAHEYDDLLKEHNLHEKVTTKTVFSEEMPHIVVQGGTEMQPSGSSSQSLEPNIVIGHIGSVLVRKEEFKIKHINHLVLIGCKEFGMFSNKIFFISQKIIIFDRNCFLFVSSIVPGTWSKLKLMFNDRWAHIQLMMFCDSIDRYMEAQLRDLQCCRIVHNPTTSESASNSIQSAELGWWDKHLVSFLDISRNLALCLFLVFITFFTFLGGYLFFSLNLRITVASIIFFPTLFSFFLIVFISNHRCPNCFKCFKCSNCFKSPSDD